MDDLVALTTEVRRLFHVLGAAAEHLHRDPQLTAAHRAVLESLYRGGPQTVPALAKARPVSRQHIQVLVNRLAELDLVEARENPAHLRSSLIALTPTGRRRFETMQGREQRAIELAELPVSRRDLEDATRTLRALREFFAGPEWSRVSRTARGRGGRSPRSPRR